MITLCPSAESIATRRESATVAAESVAVCRHGSPYFAKRSPPKKPQELTGHNCINLRLPTHEGHRELHVRVDGQLVFNSITLRVNAALEGRGVAFLPEDAVQPYVEKGRLARVLEDWCPPFPGYHLYYPSRRQTSPAFALLVEALRYRASKA